MPWKNYLGEIGVAMATGFAAWFFTRKKSKAEASKSELEAVQEAIKIWRDTGKELHDEIQKLREENVVLRKEINRLEIELFAAEELSTHRLNSSHLLFHNSCSSEL